MYGTYQFIWCLTKLLTCHEQQVSIEKLNDSLKFDTAVMQYVTGISWGLNESEDATEVIKLFSIQAPTHSDL